MAPDSWGPCSHGSGLVDEAANLVEEAPDEVRGESHAPVEQIPMKALREVRVLLGQIVSADEIEEVEAVPVGVPTGQRRPAADLHRMIRSLDHGIPSLLRAIANLDPVVRVETFLQLYARRSQEDTRRVH